MAFPSIIDSPGGTAAQGTSLLTSPDHSQDHRILGSAVVSIETFLGTNSATNVFGGYVSGQQPLPINSGTLGTVISKGTINNAIIGSQLSTGGTANNQVLGTPTLILGSDAAGDTFFRSAGGTVNRLAVGAVGRALTTSSGTLPTFGDARGVFNAKSQQLVVLGTASSSSYISMGSLALSTADIPVPSLLLITAGLCFTDQGGGDQTNPQLTWGSVGGSVIAQGAVTLPSNASSGMAALTGVLAVPAGAGTIFAAFNRQSGPGSVTSSNNNSYISAIIISQ